ncbi:MAG TPA: hypothetical protein VIH42_11485 [Thermoguttaceae bacterium]
MNARLTCKLGLLVLLICQMALCWLIQTASAQQQTPSPPKFKEIEKAVWGYFKSQENFQASALITRDQVELLLTELKRTGFVVPDQQSLLDKLPMKGEFLTSELDSPVGRKFCERIAKYPEAYDRLDRLSRLPHGKQTVHDLIYGPGGYKMIQYLTTASGGKEMGNMLSNAPQGADFNKPTGRIYTVQMLLGHLKKQYDAAEMNSAEKK